jgi:hypothetical protein
MKSVLQDWVMNLPLREQGTLLTAVRGCDLVPKYPLDSPERQLTGWIRYTFLNPADYREVGIKGAFFQQECPDIKPSCVGHYPLHWVMHIVHSLEVIAFRHPNVYIAHNANKLYNEFVKSFHLKAESEVEMVRRLSEDRIQTNTVVS